jgi:single-strand DNA-binding protein
MKNLLNSVRLFGNVGKDPIITQFENGNKVAKWSMATNEKIKNAKGETMDDVQWHNMVAWGNVATVVEKYVSKGTRLSIEGKLHYRRFVNKDGEEKEVAEIVVKDVLLVEKAGNRKMFSESESEMEAEVEHSEMPF